MTDRSPPMPPPPRPAPATPSPSDPVGITIDAVENLVAALVRRETSAAEHRAAIDRTVDRARANLEMALRQLFHAGGPRRSSSSVRMPAVRVDEAGAAVVRPGDEGRSPRARSLSELGDDDEEG